MPLILINYLLTRLSILTIVTLCLCSFSYGQPGEWVQLGLDNEEINTLAVDMHSDSIIFAGSASDFSAGTQGGIFRTTNAGATWDTLVRGVDVSRLIMHPESSNVIFASLGSASYNQPGILKSVDGGSSWFRSDSGMQLMEWESVVSLEISRSNPNVLFAGTAYLGSGGLRVTTDGGRFWKAVHDTVAQLGGSIGAIGVDPADGGKVIVSNNLGTLFYSQDGGVSWLAMHFPEFNGGGATQFLFTSNPAVIFQTCGAISASHKGVFKSVDGGTSWINIAGDLPGVYATGLTIVATQNAPNREIFLGGFTYVDRRSDSGWVDGVWSSHDEGATWQLLGSDSLYVTSLQLSRDDKSLFAGVSTYLPGRSGVYKWDVATGVHGSPQTLPTECALFQNYPNPFNPSTTISYTLPAQSFVTLAVFNVLGQEAATLVNGIESPGRKSVRFDGSGLPSGVYFYRLQVGSYVAVQKLLLTR